MIALLCELRGTAEGGRFQLDRDIYGSCCFVQATRLGQRSKVGRRMASQAGGRMRMMERRA